MRPCASTATQMISKYTLARVSRASSWARSHFSIASVFAWVRTSFVADSMCARSDWAKGAFGAVAAKWSAKFRFTIRATRCAPGPIPLSFSHCSLSRSFVAQFAVIQSAVEPIKRVISKLVVRGQFCVSDELLVELTGAFPYLDTLKLLPEGGHCTVRGPGLGTMVQRLQHLRVLYLGGCATLETLYLDAPSLERLALRRVAALRELRLQAPQIRNLVMDKCPDRPLMNPIHGLAQALAGCSQLEWLFLGGVLTTEAEVASLPLSRFRQLKGLELRVPFVGIELSIAVIGSLQWKNLSTLCLEMALSDELLAIIAQQGTQLEDVDLCAAPLSALSNGAVTEMLFSLHRLTRFALHDADTLTKLSVVSPSLQHLQVINCLDVQEVTFDCPQLMTLELRGCDKLAGRVHFVTEYRPASIVMGEGADAHVVAALAGRPLIKREK